ncbi:MAG TPA: hypothetical protein H9871_02785, partial [Candidatus Nesterenkonia stercoripullorum]|nr:hypothetical protein [Candidatus Nesterenkonia stercoripullorum]
KASLGFPVGKIWVNSVFMGAPSLCFSRAVLLTVHAWAGFFSRNVPNLFLVVSPATYPILPLGRLIWEGEKYLGILHTDIPPRRPTPTCRVDIPRRGASDGASAAAPA